MALRFRSAAAAGSAFLALLCHPASAQDMAKCKISQIARLPVVMEGPRASVAVSINGKPTRLWLDSGAFFNFMPKAKAVEFGLVTQPLPAGYRVSGIGGSFEAQRATVRDFGLAGATLHDMEFIVGGSDVGNGFLGANLLGVVDTEFDLAKGVVGLFKESGCDKVNLAYWGKGMAIGEARLQSTNSPYDHHIYVEVFVNGRAMRAGLDTGAPTTMIGRKAAEKAGIDLADPKVVASASMGGVGSHRRQSWIARTKSISIGGETIANSPIRVIDDSADERDHDMLLGVDFLMSHHVLVSQPQRKMFLTYSGGPIFSVSTDREIGHMVTRAEGMGASEVTDEPKTADAFAGRASAKLTRGETAAAIADFDQAIRLAPGRADLLGDRADAHLRNRQPALALHDLDAALAIAPKDHRLLTRRAQVRFLRGDRDGARTDTEAAAAALPRGSLDVMPVVTLYERLGLADRGLALLDPVIDLHREDSRLGSLLNARSWNRALANTDLDRALKDINTAIKRAGPVPDFLDTRGLVQFRRKDFTAAIADETAALDKAPGLAAALFTRGLARLASGDSLQGQADLVAARKIQPAIDQRYAAYGISAPGAAKSNEQPDFDIG